MKLWCAAAGVDDLRDIVNPPEWLREHIAAEDRAQERVARELAAIETEEQARREAAEEQREAEEQARREAAERERREAEANALREAVARERDEIDREIARREEAEQARREAEAHALAEAARDRAWSARPLRTCEVDDCDATWIGTGRYCARHAGGRVRR